MANDPAREKKIVRFLGDTDTFKVQNCGAAKSAFDLVPGEGYAFVPTEAGVSIALEVY